MELINLNERTKKDMCIYKQHKIQRNNRIAGGQSERISNLGLCVCLSTHVTQNYQIDLIFYTKECSRGPGSGSELQKVFKDSSPLRYPYYYTSRMQMCPQDLTKISRS